MVVGKPNLVKDFCPKLPLDLDLDFVLGLGQAFQKKYKSDDNPRSRRQQSDTKKIDMKHQHNPYAACSHKMNHQDLRNVFDDYEEEDSSHEKYDEHGVRVERQVFGF